MERDGAHRRVLHRAMALVTTNFARDTYAIREGLIRRGERVGAVARDRVENKIGGERRRAPERGTLSSSGRIRHTKEKLLINVQNNKLEVQSRMAWTILLYRVYLALLSLSVNDRPKECTHTNTYVRTHARAHTQTHTHQKYTINTCDILAQLETNEHTQRDYSFSHRSFRV